MDQGMVDSFVEAAVEVLREIGIAASGSPAPADRLRDGNPAFVVTVGILGDARGSLLLRFDRSSAAAIVAAMYRSLGLEGRQRPEAAEAAVGEIANQICGRAVTILSRRAVECDITPPAVIAGTDLTSALPGSAELVSRRLEGPFGSLVVSLGLTG